MNNDFIKSYISYKVKRLSEFASVFFVDFDDDFIMSRLNKYFDTYIDTYFYHTLATLDDGGVFDFKTVKEEFIGIRDDLLDEYANLELVVSNVEYKKNKNAICEMVDICLFVCQLDLFRFTSKELINEEFDKFITRYSVIKERLGDNLSKLLAKVKENFILENKIFNDDNSYFVVDYSNELKKDTLYLTKIKHTIKILESNYKKSMVERVFSDDRFTLDKIKTIFWKLSREIMRKFLNGENVGKYIVVIDDKLFQSENIELFNMINNSFLQRYLVLAVSFNGYAYNKSFLEKLGFSVACNLDLSHVGEVLDRLNSIDSEKFFAYILVNDYKDSDKETILGYECSTNVELYITKED